MNPANCHFSVARAVSTGSFPRVIMNPIRYPRLILCLLVMTLLVALGSARGQPPQIASLLPALGPPAGATTVIAVGARFRNGPTLNFGPLASTSAHVLNPTALDRVT